MKAALVAVGTELLLGDVVNSNAARLGRHLAAAGVEVVTSVAVADDVPRIAETIRLCLVEADVVITCGGLGPTVDDVTREAVGLACDVPLRRDASVEEVLRARYSAYAVGGVVPEEVFRQADVPVGAELLANPVGTAPGLWLEKDGRVVVALPGPPRELEAVLPPVLERLATRSGRVITTRQVLVTGLGESAVAERVQRLLELPEGVALSYLAGPSLVRVRFTSTDAGLLPPLVAVVEEALGDHVFGYDEQTLDGVVHELLAARGETVAVAESLTGGLLAAALTHRAGASTTFRGGIVAYATDVKGALAGVPPPLLASEGAVSEGTAAAMAGGARERVGSDWGLAVTGVAGPTEQEGHPVGTVFVAVAGPHGGQVRQLRVPGDRNRVREVSVTSALDLLRRHLSGKVQPGL